MIPSGLKPIGSHGEDTSISSATALTNTAGARYLLLQAFAQNVRYTVDGTTPDANTGFQMAAGDPPILLPLTGNATVTVIEEAAGGIVQYQWME